MATLFKTTGEVQQIAPANGEKFTLDELRRLIGGGWLETISVNERGILVCDEDGLLKELPANENVSDMFGIELVGNVVYCKNEEFD